MNRLQFSLTLVILTAFTTAGIAQKISRTEKKILENVGKNHSEAIVFLEKVVNINSGTMNLDGVRKVGEEFDVALKALGFETRWSEMPDEMNRAGHLFADHSVSGLLCHDSVVHRCLRCQCSEMKSLPVNLENKCGVHP